MATLRKYRSTMCDMASTIHKLQTIIGYKFNNSQRAWEAVQSPGAIIRSGELDGAGLVRHSHGWQRIPDGNRRLAVLGDTVLKLALVEDWFKGDAIRERLSRIVSDVGSNANLDRQARTHGLDQLINSSPAIADVPIGTHAMATTVEAIIGAVYLDGGMRFVPQVMQNLGLMPKIVRRTMFDSRRFDKATGTASEEGLTKADSTTTSNVKTSKPSKTASPMDNKESSQQS